MPVSCIMRKICVPTQLSYGIMYNILFTKTMLYQRILLQIKPSLGFDVLDEFFRERRF